ncbi:GntR family transcriptional regulator [Sporosarcina ureilytica]|uniref:GntR family transcriptional regulator n=1 Tax=Sporosarcina ureilytica TaxID=298596 RepID=A0A1D8JG65_9BACL|nr:GntR family transcriptional regulator [Sporosarcina ureilytica]AOV07719.1 GntR family transcriptional regulator [Sporosarcina ureilytica]
MSRIETSPLTKQVYEIIRKKIISREYVAGDKLDIQTLADTFGVSRSPVKDAINQLVHEGLIEVIPRKGTYVTELKLTEFLEVLDARLMIEKWAAEEIIGTITEEQIQIWSEIVKQMDALLEVNPFPFEEYSSLDMNFHKLLIGWAKNTRVKEIYFSLNTHVSLSRVVYSTSLESTVIRHKDHWDLVEAMKNRDLSTFSEILTKHINSLKAEAESRWDETIHA